MIEGMLCVWHEVYFYDDVLIIDGACYVVMCWRVYFYDDTIVPWKITF